MGPCGHFERGSKDLDNSGSLDMIPYQYQGEPGAELEQCGVEYGSCLVFRPALDIRVTVYGWKGNSSGPPVGIVCYFRSSPSPDIIL